MANSKDPSTNLSVVKADISADEWQTLDGVIELAQESLTKLLDAFFATTDDMFYELSERALNHNEENAYLEAMRATRLAKTALCSSFNQKLHNSFQNMAKPKVTEQPNPATKTTLSIVESDDLEIALAQKSMADRTRETFKPALRLVEANLNGLCPRCPISTGNNPLDPMVIADAFVTSAVSELTFDIKTRLIFFKLFEKHILKALGELYDDINALLAEQGVKPRYLEEVKSVDKPQTPMPSKQSSPSEPETFATSPETQENPSDSASDSAGHAESNTNAASFSIEAQALASLMASIRNNPESTTTIARALQSQRRFSSNTGSIMPIPELAAQLTDSQRTLDERLQTESPANLVPELVDDILSLKNPDLPQSLAQQNEDIINLISLFFDKVLEDGNLPIAVQSLICRLQIPVLKIALHDATILTNEHHPARLLINTIAEAGLNFDDSKPIERDPLYKVLTDGVQRINHEFRLDTAIINEVTELFRQAIDNDLTKSSTVETRMMQAETGKATLKKAKSCAQQAILEEIGDKFIHHAIAEFLTRTWQQVMIITYVRTGNTSDEWQQNVEALSLLIAAAEQVSGHKQLVPESELSEQSTPKAEDSLPTDAEGSLSQSAEGSLPTEAEGSLTQIAEGSLHTEAEGPLPTGAEGSLPTEAEGSPISAAESANQAQAISELLTKLSAGLSLVVDNEPARDAKLSSLKDTLSSIAQDHEVDSAFGQLNDEQRHILGEKPQQVIEEEQAALQRQQSRYEQLTNKYYLEAKHMTLGTWFIYQDDNKNKTLRCKLSTKIDAENYIFVNKFGFKVFSKSRKEFAYDMQFKKATPLDIAPKFERIMESVIKQLSSLGKNN